MAVVELPFEVGHAQDPKEQEEHHRDHQYIYYSWACVDQGQHCYPQSLISGDHPQRPKHSQDSQYLNEL